ncbi:MAG: TSUP family transporter [Desulfovibrionaceae bacterium]|nr:TSUP family transporter [Desulfovibrionaceae bacterium]
MLTFSFLTCIVAVFAAFVAGFVDAIAGGGGLIVLPVLLLTGLPPHVAVSCNKFSCTLGTAVALANFARSHLVLWKTAALGVVFSLVGSYFGTRLALSISPEIFAKTLILLLPVALVATIVPPRQPQNAKPKTWLIPIICTAIGCYDGFFGPATGSFLILAFHFALAMDLLAASATAKALNLASNVASAITFICAGTVWWTLAIPMAVASILGNFLGSRLAIHGGSQIVRRFLIVVLLILLSTLIAKHFF